jgi:hypothetical protein
MANPAEGSWDSPIAYSVRAQDLDISFAGNGSEAESDEPTNARGYEIDIPRGPAYAVPGQPSYIPEANMTDRILGRGD